MVMSPELVNPAESVKGIFLQKVKLELLINAAFKQILLTSQSMILSTDRRLIL